MLYAKKRMYDTRFLLKKRSPFLLFSETSQNVGQKVGVKAAWRGERAHITVVLAADASGGKLPAMIIFKGKPTPPGETPASNSIEREFKNYKDRKGNSYPRDLVYAVDEIAVHSQQVFDNVWVPQVWNQRPGGRGQGEGPLGTHPQPDTLLAWDSNTAHTTVHKTEASKAAMAKSNTTLFFIPGGRKPKLQPCDRLMGKLFTSEMRRLYRDHMASSSHVRNDYGYPDRGLLAQWVKKAWDNVDADSIRSSWREAGLLLPFDGSGDAAWANEELGAKPSYAP